MFFWTYFFFVRLHGISQRINDAPLKMFEKKMKQTHWIEQRLMKRHLVECYWIYWIFCVPSTRSSSMWTEIETYSQYFHRQVIFHWNFNIRNCWVVARSHFYLLEVTRAQDFGHEQRIIMFLAPIKMLFSFNFLRSFVAQHLQIAQISMQFASNEEEKRFPFIYLLLFDALSLSLSLFDVFTTIQFMNKEC